MGDINFSLCCPVAFLITVLGIVVAYATVSGIRRDQAALREYEENYPVAPIIKPQVTVMSTPETAAAPPGRWWHLQAKTHAVLWRLGWLGTLISPCALCIVVPLLSTTNIPKEWEWLIFFGILLGYISLWRAFAYRWPVRCDTPGCHGWMNRRYDQISKSKGRLQYQCTQCGGRHQADILAFGED